jgi:DNA replication and repair protein RecF
LLLRRLTLAYFRNYVRLDLALEPGLSLFWGDNGQGKSNLLEAAYMLATTRSFRTSSERDLLNWHADTDPPFARIAADVERTTRADKLELLVVSQPESVRRRARINSHDRPLTDLLGHFNAVLFSPEDVDLVSGPAERRRRYLDITLCQVSPTYLRTLRRYVRVLTQRNALLKLARERTVPPDEFEYWDSQLTTTGAALLVARLVALGALNHHLTTLYPQLTNQGAALRLEYRSTVPLDGLAVPYPDSTVSPEERTALEQELVTRYVAQLAAQAPRERAQAVTLTGAHRDDASFSVDGVDMRTYGSRGQQRIAALALRLAETEFMHAATGERPVLLLDDVMSELDPSRRRYLQTAVLTHEQVLITATDLASFEPEFLAGVRRFRVAGGEIHPESP